MKYKIKILFIASFLLFSISRGVSADVTGSSASNPNIPNSPTIKTHVDLPKYSTEESPVFPTSELPKTGESNSSSILIIGAIAIVLASFIGVYKKLNENH